MNVDRDDKRRVHVEYMNTRAAVYTFRSPYTATGIFRRASARSSSRDISGSCVLLEVGESIKRYSE